MTPASVGIIIVAGLGIIVGVIMMRRRRQSKLAVIRLIFGRQARIWYATEGRVEGIYFMDAWVGPVDEQRNLMALRIIREGPRFGSKSQKRTADNDDAPTKAEDYGQTLSVDAIRGIRTDDGRTYRWNLPARFLDEHGSLSGGER